MFADPRKDVKASIAGGILLLVILVLVILNAWYIHSVTREMNRMVESLPQTPEPATLAHIAAFQAYFEEKHPLLRITIGFSQLDRVTELSESLLEYAQSGSLPDYRATRRLLLDAIQDMSRLERLWQKSEVGQQD